VKKVFVSYSSLDEQVVSLFIDKVICDGAGLDKEDILFSAREIFATENDRHSYFEGLKQCRICFFMVSDNYRKSEECLQEMGSLITWNDIIRKIIIMPDTSFDRIGYLSLHDGISISNADGLDAVHDLLVDACDTRVQTAFWNRSKAVFIEKLSGLVGPSNRNEVVVFNDGREELDLLDMREAFDKYLSSYTTTVNAFAEEIKIFTQKLNEMSQALTLLNRNPEAFTPSRVRRILLDGAEQNDKLAAFFENNTPSLQNDFDAAMKYAIMMQESGAFDAAVKAQNREQCRILISTLVSLRAEVRSFRDAMSDIVDLDKTYRKSKLRLIKAVDQMLDVLAFCVSRANDYQLT